MTDLDELLRDLEAATGPDRELSDRVLRAFPENVHKDGGWVRASWWHENFRPDPVASLDDALVLVPKGWRRIDAIFLEGRDQFFTIENQAMARGNTAPLAVCIAVLRARKEPQ